MQQSIQSAPVRIGLLTMRDARNPRSWSGTPYFLSNALEQAGASLDYLGPLNTGFIRGLRAIGKLRRKIGLTGTLANQSHIAARIMARQIETKLKTTTLDAVFSPAGSSLISLLETDLPVAYSSDATLRLVTGYYPEYSGVSDSAIREADSLEQKAIQRADLLLYPTRWVAQSAIDHYGADPAKIRIQPYGANLAQTPPRERVLAPRKPGPIRLLFVGVSWVRKGGDIALSALRSLQARGIDVRLTVIGCTPPPDVNLNGVTVIPFLDKNDPEQRRTLVNHYLEADLFLLPTRSECYGIVFCEASAYGLPSVTTATGGVPDVVTEGVNGFCLSLDADGPAYADKIENIMQDPAAYHRLRVSSRDTYEARLNWQVWGTSAVTAFRELTRKV